MGTFHRQHIWWQSNEAELLLLVGADRLRSDGIRSARLSRSVGAHWPVTVPKIPRMTSTGRLEVCF